jgi:UDPglucose 6-dehydrogenase
MRLAIVGTGYVGLVTGVCLSEVGHDVSCVDLNAEKVAKLKEGICPIFEPDLEGMMRRNQSHERLHFTTDLKSALTGAKVVFIAVGTPEGEDGSADLTYVKAVARSIGQQIADDIIVVVKSTVPVGTCDLVAEVIDQELKTRGSKIKVTVASNPEFLKEGAAVGDFMRPDRIIVGLNDLNVSDTFVDMYTPFILDDPGKLLIMDRRSSELSKYGANAMLATRISFMNEMAILCEKVGANVDKVRIAMGSDPRIGRKFLHAGPGYGGSCFPKDVAALIRSGESHGVELSVLTGVSQANVRQREYVFGKIEKHFGSLKGKTVAVWGLTFKPGTDDVRETPSNMIIESLLKAGASVRGHDPEGIKNFSHEFGERKGLSYSENSYEILKDADALVLVTEWSEYRRPSWDKIAGLMKQKTVFDLRNQYDAHDLISRGFHYQCIGRPDSTGLSK